MAAVSPSDVLDVWDRGRNHTLPERALDLLQLALPHRPVEALAALGIGERDAALLRLRAHLFGNLAECVSSCVQCGETVSFEIDTHRLLAAAAPTESVQVECGGRSVEARLPNTADQLALLAAGPLSADDARSLVLHRCLFGVDPDASTQPAEELAREDMLRLEAAMTEADPLADIRLPLRCERCGQQWETCFDITALLWDECATLARRLLREVHTLAWAYGWSEHDILSLSASRRRFYLECLGA